MLVLAASLAASIDAQGGRRGGAPAADAPVTILKPARVFDGASRRPARRPASTQAPPPRSICRAPR
jgi:hypothetical protein